MVRVERFELLTKLILSQPPLPIGLHALEFAESRMFGSHEVSLVLAEGFEPTLYRF